MDKKNISYEIASGIMYQKDGYFINIYKLRCDTQYRVHIKKLVKEVK